MTMTLVAPTVADYEASADLASLLVRTAQDDALSVSAETLRLSCKCAHCTRARFDGRFPKAFPGIAITDIGDLGYGSEHFVFGWAQPGDLSEAVSAELGGAVTRYSVSFPRARRLPPSGTDIAPL
ncbi:hypothetical protein ABH995_003851 [Bradyrhizobium yuanmingense]